MRSFQEQIDAEFKKEDRLFHYTSAQGLYGIFESKCIWATHYRFLNDSKELHAARSSIENSVKAELHRLLTAYTVNNRKTLKKDVILRDVAAEEAVKFTNYFYDVTSALLSTYVFSMFCASPSEGRIFSDGGLLHWATYGKAGGYALQINPFILSEILQHEHERYPQTFLGLGRVEYGSGIETPRGLTSHYKVINQAVEDYFSETFETGKDISVEAKERLIRALGNSFVAVTSFCKDEYFSDEREARVVAMRTNSPTSLKLVHPISVRHAGSTSVPFVKLLENTLIGDDGPIERIIIGPHPENERRMIALKGFLESRGLSTIELSISSVPYVSFST